MQDTLDASYSSSHAGETAATRPLCMTMTLGFDFRAQISDRRPPSITLSDLGVRLTWDPVGLMRKLQEAFKAKDYQGSKEKLRI